MHRPLKERKKKQKRKKGCYYYLSISLRVLGDSNTIRGFDTLRSVVLNQRSHAAFRERANCCAKFRFYISELLNWLGPLPD
jgi:hypothetical protein